MDVLGCVVMLTTSGCRGYDGSRFFDKEYA